jgi:peroxiredoxin Q/BCP
MVSVDDPETNKEFAESLEADFPILSNPEKDVAEAYGVLGERGFASRWTFYIGKDGTILDVDTQVQANTAGQDVVAKLTALGIDKR